MIPIKRIRNSNAQTLERAPPSTETAEFGTEVSCEKFKCGVTFENQPNGR